MRVFGLIAVILLNAVPASAQTDTEKVVAVVNRLFEGMRTGDSAMVRSTFDDRARLQGAGINPRTGEAELSTTPVDGFVRFVGGLTPGQANEPIWDLVVQVDGHLATVWAKYEMIYEGVFRHCGVDAFELWKSADGWKIFQLTDTRRTEDCWHQPGM